MTVSAEVHSYVARQPRLRWRRVLLRGLIRSLGFKVLWDVTVTGAENIPAGGPTIIMMNHISLIDPVLCMGAVTSRFVIPMTKIENMQHLIIGPFVRWWGSYTVNRGEIDRKALTNSIELIKHDQLILIAPEGHRHPEGLGEAKDGLAFIATKANAVIIPTAISGAVGWNHKLFRFQRPTININFGKPFKFKTGSGSRVPREALTTMSHEAMYQLAIAVKDDTKRGFYSDLTNATTDYIEFVKT